jgi:radical SAM superfamily enzyme YgiQ (UPF0313 family)
MKIWLADLTYTQQTIASDTFPAAVGMIGAFLRENFPALSELRLFKYPEELATAFETDAPDLIGFSNYCWNTTLARTFAAAIKRRHPKIIIVMGGPNFPMDPLEQDHVLRSHPEIDFFVIKEAEIAFLRLVESLHAAGLDRDRFEREAPRNLPNLHYLDRSGKLQASTTLERVRNLEALPSPYLTGDMDRFFDGRLLPVIQTNRGCPFSCTFCTEGQTYWSKVHFKPADLVRREIELIAERLAALPANKRRTDLLIADSNFGMYQGDLDTCRVLAGTQASHNYPKYINVATGKNSKERVLEAARLVNGAMKLAGSVQSLDPDVMKNIKRANISSEQIVEMAMKSSEIGTNTYSEVILALPGDTKEKHFLTLKTLIDSGFNTVSMYQLMVLPGTELGSKESKERYHMRGKYRVLPRCFGYYRFGDELLVSAEVEEICVEHATLSYQDYLDCRRMNLFVNIFYNDSVFAEIMKLVHGLGLSQWDFLLHLYTRKPAPRFQEIVNRFIEETRTEGWDDSDAFKRYLQDPAVIDKYIAGEYGSNLIFKYKALSMTEYFDAVADEVSHAIEEFLSAHTVAMAWRELAQEIVRYNRHRVTGIFSPQRGSRSDTFHFDVLAFSATAGGGDPERFRRPAPATIEFKHTAEQSAELDGYLSTFGSDTRGLSRILSRVFLKKYFRNPTANEAAHEGGRAYFGQAVVGQS